MLLIGRPEAIAAAGELPAGVRTVALPSDEPPHPVRDLANAARALDRARGGLELVPASIPGADPARGESPPSPRADFRRA